MLSSEARLWFNSGNTTTASRHRRCHDGDQHGEGISEVWSPLLIVLRRRERGRLELGVGTGDLRLWLIAVFCYRYDEENESGRSARGKEERWEGEGCAGFTGGGEFGRASSQMPWSSARDSTRALR
jgi:hypothetical protein